MGGGMEGGRKEGEGGTETERRIREIETNREIHVKKDTPTRRE